ncbi:hypothetical protein AX14_008580 [Amanita brunnescens Koide BX004]|nr:hypothetical protein AX14_008580 [Amanita brunnescens Koide BX004]
MYAVQANHKPPSAASRLRHTESPLDTLVRQTSVRREHVPRQDPRSVVDSGHPLRPEPSKTPRPHPHIDTRILVQADAHHSPLLHGHFARDSYATASSKDYNSFLATSSARSSTEYRYDDAESVYSVVPPVNNVRVPWHAVSDHDSMFFPTPPIDSASAGVDLKPSSRVDGGLNQPVPTVVVSWADNDERENCLHRGRTPVMASGTPNFSRPGRPVIPPSGDEKRRVLERNIRRMREPSPSFDNNSPSPEPDPSHMHAQGRSPPLPRGTTSSGQSPMSTSSRSSSRSPSPFVTAPTAMVGNPPSSDLNGPAQNLTPPKVIFTPNAISLPRTPPPRSLSPAASLYSSYSFYPIEGPPLLSASNSPAPAPAGQHIQVDPQNTQTPAPIYNVSSQEPRTPQEYLQLGIQYHEANKLEDSALCFEKSANEKGGCGIGMLMWGLTLRHGWGCPKDEKRGFKWLRRAAESAVEDLENARIGTSLDPEAIQTELVLSIYEVGQCFFQGWGVPKDQKMAVSYYQVAARLGDADAQSDLAFCLANGKGCKKDRKEAAKWYRAAVGYHYPIL